MQHLARGSEKLSDIYEGYEGKMTLLLLNRLNPVRGGRERRVSADTSPAKSLTLPFIAIHDPEI